MLRIVLWYNNVLFAQMTRERQTADEPSVSFFLPRAPDTHIHRCVSISLKAYSRTSVLLSLRRGSFVALFLVYLLFPTRVDCISDDLPVARVDAPNEKYLDIVLDGDKLRVVDSRFPRNLFALLGHFDPYRCKS